MNRCVILLPALLGLATILISQPVVGGENPNVRLAMHCVATNQYLYELRDCPQSCDEIDCDLTREELSLTGGYGMIFLVAYNVNGLASIEYALDYPDGVSTTFEPTEYWCGESALSLGNREEDGRIVSWGLDLCLEPESSNGGVAFAFIRVRYRDTQPVVFKWAPSEFSYGFDPHNYTMDCTSNYREDPVVAHHGAVIGGKCSDPCMGGLQESSWGEVKQKYRY
jgi:hypothetical protein